MDQYKLQLLKKQISGWVRQSKYRARQIGLDHDIDYKRVIQIFEELDYKCVYCSEEADRPDNAFPLCEDTPCVVANVLPICDKCKSKKKRSNIIKMYQMKNLTEDKLHRIIKFMMTKDGSPLLRLHIKKNYSS